MISRGKREQSVTASCNTPFQNTPSRNIVSKRSHFSPRAPGKRKTETEAALEIPAHPVYIFSG